MQDLIPITLFLTIGVVLCVYFYLRYRWRLAIQETVRTAIERGQELTPDVLEAIGGDTHSAPGDLRKGVIWLALAFAMGLMSWVLAEPDLLGPAALPLMLGVAYLALWLYGSRKRA